MNTEKFKITKKSWKTLLGWHAGSGWAFISEGTGTGSRSFFFQLFKARNGKTFIGLGNKKAIKLTDEQALALESFIIPELPEED